MSEEKIIWKSLTIIGFEHYVISTGGEIINTKNCRRVKGWKNEQGYHRVTLSNPERRIKLYVHRLVAITFIGLPEDQLEVHHINGRRYDNNYKNLEWVTRQENMRHVHNKTETKEEDDLPF